MALNLNKKVLIHTGAGVAAVLLLLFGVHQCSEKQDERDINKQNIEQLKNANTQLSNAADALKEANSKISDLSYANDVQADSIIVLNDSIGVLNDSIVVLNDSLTIVKGDLEDCRNSKKPVAPVKKTKKPVIVKPKQEQKKEQPVINNVINNNINNNVNGVVGANVKLDENARNNGDITIVNGNQVPNNSTVILGKGAVNEGTITINNGGVINNYYQNEKADTVKQAVKKYAAASGVVIVKRTRVIQRVR